MSEDKAKSLGLFDYINSINDKKYLFEENVDTKGYGHYTILKAFSYYPDTILLANELNKYRISNKKMSYDFFYYAIDKRKRYSKWFKQTDDETIDLLQQHYQCSRLVAEEYKKLLNDQQIEQLKKKYFKGGVK